MTGRGSKDAGASRAGASVQVEEAFMPQMCAAGHGSFDGPRAHQTGPVPTAGEQIVKTRQNGSAEPCAADLGALGLTGDKDVAALVASAPPWPGPSTPSSAWTSGMTQNASSGRKSDTHWANSRATRNPCCNLAAAPISETLPICACLSGIARINGGDHENKACRLTGDSWNSYGPDHRLRPGTGHSVEPRSHRRFFPAFYFQPAGSLTVRAAHRGSAAGDDHPLGEEQWC